MLKKYLPLVLYTFLRKKISRPIFCKSYFKYWQKRFLAYSGFCNPEKAASKRALIIMRSHVIEKGLSMPHFRLGFGQEMLNDLIEDLRNCKPAFDRDPAIIAASHVVNEYAKVHMENKHELPDELLKKIQMVRQKFGSFASRQPEIDKNEYFSHTQENFQSFALSRHSCRYFSGTAPKNVLQDAVILANKISPSACNRQAVRVHLIDDYDIVQKILIFQGGCRGFHEDIGQILMIAVDMEYTMHIKEYHDLYLNAGLYLMNLAYALHFHRIGSCFLTWSVTPEIDKKTRSLVQIPDQEEIVHILAVGEVPEIFRLAFSEKTFGQKLQEHGAI